MNFRHSPVNILTLVCSSMTSKLCFQTSWFLAYLPRWTSWKFRIISETQKHFPPVINFDIFLHGKSKSWQINCHLGKFNLRLLVRTDKLRWILKLYICRIGRRCNWDYLFCSETLSLIIVLSHNYSLPANDKLLVVYRQVFDVYQKADDQFPFYN